MSHFLEPMAAKDLDKWETLVTCGEFGEGAANRDMDQRVGRRQPREQEIYLVRLRQLVSNRLVAVSTKKKPGDEKLTKALESLKQIVDTRIAKL